MKYLTLLITLPLTVFILAFAVSNRAMVDVSLWPLEQRFSYPFYIVGLALLALGFFCGALFVWLPTLALRFGHWRLKKHAQKLESSLSAAAITDQK